MKFLIKCFNFLFLISVISSNVFAEQQIPSFYNAEKVYYFCSLAPKIQTQEKDWIEKTGKLDFLTFDNLQDWREAGLCTGYLASAFDTAILNPKVCISKRLKFDQVINVFTDYYENNPDKKHLPGVVVAVNAFSEKYKCE